MPRDVVSDQIFKRIMARLPPKSMRPESVRIAIHRIHEKNPSITMNAAAYQFAKRKGFSVFRYLSQDDKLSLQHLKSATNTEAISGKGRGRTGGVREFKPDFETLFAKEANENANIYPHIYILENTLRDVIFERLGSLTDWWINKKMVYEEIQNYAERIKQAEQKHPWMKDRGDHPLYYVGLYELFRIIEKNWNPHFRAVFRDLELLRSWIKESVPIRNYVAHNVKTRDLEKSLIKKNTDYICRLVEKWRKKNEKF
jgi:hypothetical protein